MKHTTRKKALHFLWAFLMVCQSSLAQTSNKPSTYALVIGISDYKDDLITDLSYAHRDAEAFANYLYSKAGGSLKSDQVNLLTNEQATFGNITVGLDWLSDVAKEGDRIILYFAGHGDVETKTVARRGFLLSYDSPSTNYRSNSLGLDMLSDYCNTFTQLKKAKVVLITDACHAGNLAGRQVKGSEITSTALIENFPNQVRILSCQPQEYSLEGRQWGEGRGVFSFYLINGLFGMADKNQDQSVTLLELQTYLQEQVPAQTAPQMQVPLAYGGNMQEKIGIVDPQTLDALKKRREDQTLTFASIEHRGLESVILSGLDTSLVHIFKLYKQALIERRFFEPKGECAAYYYEQIKKESSETKAFPIIQRQFAAALMEAVQEEINRSLRDQEETGRRGDVSFLPRVQFAQQCVLKTIELVGSAHSMYKALLARKHHFEALKYYYQDIEANSIFVFKALQEMEQAFKFDSLNADLYNTYGLLLQENRSKRAYLYFEKAFEMAPHWAIPQLNLIYHWRAQRDYAKSMYYAQQVMEVAPHRWFAPYQLAIETARKDPQNAVALFEQTLKLPQYKAYVFNSMTNVFKRIGDTSAIKVSTERYLNEIKKSLTTNPGNQPYFEAIIQDVLKKDPQSDLPKSLKEQIPVKWEDIYYALGQYYHFGAGRDYKKAEFYFLEFLKINPNHLWANYKLGQVYQFDIKLTTKAKSQFFKVLRLDSTHILAPINLAGIYANELKYDSAQANLQKAISIRPDFAMNYSQMANIFTKEKKFKQAEDFYLKAYACNDRDIVYMGKIANFYLYNMVQPYQSLAYYKKMLELDSNDVTAIFGLIHVNNLLEKFKEERFWISKLKPISQSSYYLRLHWHYLRKNQLDSALWAVQEGTRLNVYPKYQAIFHRGFANIKLENWAEAEKNFQNMISDYPKDMNGYWGLSVIYDQTKRFIEMEALLQKQIGQMVNEEDSIVAYCRLALAYFRLDRKEDYLKTIQEIHLRFKDEALISYQLACIDIYMQKIPEAMQYLEKASTLGVPFDLFLEDFDLDPIRPLPEFQALLKKHYPGLNE